MMLIIFGLRYFVNLYFDLENVNKVVMNAWYTYIIVKYNKVDVTVL